MSQPLVSIVILNYNGARFLEACLAAVLASNYPRDRFEVILVDNASTDGSGGLVTERFPEVRVLQNGENLGFAGGNNQGILCAAGAYVILLNNDTAPHPDWIAEMVRAAEADHQVGACAAKLLFLHDRLPVVVASPTFTPSSDPRTLGVQLGELSVRADGSDAAVSFLEGVYGPEQGPHGAFRWTSGRARLAAPVARHGGASVLSIETAASRPDGEDVEVVARLGETVLSTWRAGAAFERHEVAIPADLALRAQPTIQNAGTLLLEDGSGRDRGTVVRNGLVTQEPDLGQYDREEEVFAFCGAACLLRREMLDELGGFDERYFMYYEDLDLSWRARLRGWRILYVPTAVVRHVHAGSSGEWSDFFIYQVERSRLLMLTKLARGRLVRAAWSQHVAMMVADLLRGLRAITRRGSPRASWKLVGIRFRALVSALRVLPGVLVDRRRWLGTRTVPRREIDRWMVSR